MRGRDKEEDVCVCERERERKDEWEASRRTGEDHRPLSACAGEVGRDLVLCGGSICSWIGTYEEAGARFLTCSGLYKQRERRSRPWSQLGRATASTSDSNKSRLIIVRLLAFSCKLN